MRILLLAALALSAPTAHARLAMTCRDIKYVEGRVDGSYRLHPTEDYVDVAESRSGTHGYMGIVKEFTEVRFLQDTRLSSGEAPNNHPLRAYVERVEPRVRWSDVKTVRYANVGIAENRQRRGAHVHEFLDRRNRILKIVVVVRNQTGICTPAPPLFE